MTSFRAWTNEETDLLLERVEAGEPHRSIASSFPGRTFKSVINRIGALRHGFGESRGSSARSSIKLAEAIIDAQVRFANDGGITLAEAQRILMGGNYVEVTPGTERVLQTCAVERLAA